MDRGLHPAGWAAREKHVRGEKAVNHGRGRPHRARDADGGTHRGLAPARQHAACAPRPCARAPAPRPPRAAAAPAPQMICITDLESDYVNPFDFTTRMNAWIVGATRLPRLPSRPPAHAPPQRRASAAHPPTHPACPPPSLASHAFGAPALACHRWGVARCGVARPGRDSFPPTPLLGLGPMLVLRCPSTRRWPSSPRWCSCRETGSPAWYTRRNAHTWRTST